MFKLILKTDTGHTLHIRYNYLMDQQVRFIKMRLSWFNHYKNKSKNVAKTCRYFGISRPTFYYWFRKYKSGGPEMLYNISRRPKNSPKATKLSVVKKVIKLREKLQYGPNKIAQELYQKYRIKLSGKTIYTYLKKYKLNRL